jgi:glutathione S-transferase
MTNAAVKIFSYLPNPRVWKSLVAAQFCDVTVEVTGDKPANLQNWLWDFDARELAADERIEDSPHARVSKRGFSGTLYKTDAFLQAHPFGTVPAAFSPDGSIGIFESNSILRAVVRAADNDHGLYGRGGNEASRVDSFLDATLVLAREAQVYLLSINELSQATHERMTSAYEFYLSGIDRSLAASDYIASDQLTIADIGFACDVGQFLRERLLEDSLKRQGFTVISENMEGEYPRATAHLKALAEMPEFSTHLGGYLSRVL